MLKIKQNIDLKELEKFGFVFHKPNRWDKFSYYIKKTDYDTTHFEYGVVIYTKDYKNYYNDYRARAICQYGIEYREFAVPTIIYDLIQAGIVEKVDE